MLKQTFLLAGDIESMPFIEALGQFSYRVGKIVSSATYMTQVTPEAFMYSQLVNFYSTMLLVSGPGNFCLIHVSLVPVLNVVGEQVR